MLETGQLAPFARTRGRNLDVVHSQGGVPGSQYGTLDAVLQLTDVAWPGITFQFFDYCRLDHVDLLGHFTVGTGEEMVYEQFDIVLPFSQRRHGHRGKV